MSGSSVSTAHSFGRRGHAVPRFGLLLVVCVSAIAGSAGISQSAPVGSGGGDSTLVSSGPDGELKSETTALLWSLLGTALPAGASAPFVWTPTGNSSGAAVVLVGALVIGPSLGHFYADRPGPAFAGIGIRILAGAGVAYGGLAEGTEGGGTRASEAVAVIGAIVGGASIAWDIVRAPHSARVHNDMVRPGGVAVRVTPSVGPAGLGLRAAAIF